MPHAYPASSYCVRALRCARNRRGERDESGSDAGASFGAATGNLRPAAGEENFAEAASDAATHAAATGIADSPRDLARSGGESLGGGDARRSASGGQNGAGRRAGLER